MQQEQDDFEQMLSTMKVMEFREKQQKHQISKIFSNWSKSTHNRSQYKMALYCKVFKGLMISRLQLDAFANRLQNVYIHMLLRTHFDAYKEFKSIAQQERNQKILLVQKIIKQKQFGIFFRNINQNLAKRSNLQSKNNQKSHEIKQRTDNNFYPQQSRVETYTMPFNNKSLQDSRRSALSSFSVSSELQSKRKYTVVKQLPKLSNLHTVIQHQKEFNASDVITNRAETINEQIKTKPIEGLQKQAEDLKESKSAYKMQQKSLKTYNKQQILSLICKLKMMQISQITTLKSQSLINEKNYLNQSTRTLQTIISYPS